MSAYPNDINQNALSCTQKQGIQLPGKLYNLALYL